MAEHNNVTVAEKAELLPYKTVVLGQDCGKGTINILFCVYFNFHSCHDEFLHKCDEF